MNQISLIDLANKQPIEPLLEKEVQIRAYELYEQRGKGQGFALEDWLDAEAEILARFSNPCLRLFHSEVAMGRTFPCSSWETLYRAAILETNKGLLPQRVSEAEEAVKKRGREIFYGKGTPEEEEKEVEALEDALYTLRAFRTAWQHSDGVIAHLSDDDAMNER